MARFLDVFCFEKHFSSGFLYKKDFFKVASWVFVGICPTRQDKDCSSSSLKVVLVLKYHWNRGGSLWPCISNHFSPVDFFPSAIRKGLWFHSFLFKMVSVHLENPHTLHPVFQRFPQHYLYNHLIFSLMNHDPFSSCEGRSSSTSSFKASLLPALDDGMSLA